MLNEPTSTARAMAGGGGTRTLSSVTFDRITVEAAKMNGQPCIRGLRIPVATVVAMVADGMTEAEILQALPDLEAEDLEAAGAWTRKASTDGGALAG